MSFSPLGATVAGVLLLALVVWVFCQAGGPPPRDAARAKAVRKGRGRWRI